MLDQLSRSRSFKIKSGLVDKAYEAAGQADASLHMMAVLQAY